MNRLLRNSEAARILSISANTLNVMRSKGKGPPYIKVGGSVRYSEDDITEYIRKNSVSPENGNAK